MFLKPFKFVLDAQEEISHSLFAISITACIRTLMVENLYVPAVLAVDTSHLQEGRSVNWQVGPCYHGGKGFIPSLVRSKVAKGLGNTPGLIIVY
ncbi:PREDICTED: deleted in esophageal cancer 1 [Lipotes vexillifer]|uniref:Deleted in esophageal cancer 1 n=1 Tax=Lipotes vexillifer TaxID=118797 RepID=A0A340WJU4_LIPVE|nr:PREDICTED: deleted in esophageal cancer 1 [Lipotes vexillifer]